MRLTKTLITAAFVATLALATACGKNSDTSESAETQSVKNMNEFLQGVLKELEGGNKLSSFNGAEKTGTDQKKSEAIVARFADGKSLTLENTTFGEENEPATYSSVKVAESQPSAAVDATCLKDFLKEKLPLDSSSYLTGLNPAGKVTFFAGEDTVLSWDSAKNTCLK